MTFFSFNVSYVSRRQGRSVSAVAAYRSGERLHDYYTGKIHDYTNRKDILFKQILLPLDAPPECENRQTFITAIDSSENRSDSRTAREIKLLCQIDYYLRNNLP